MSARSTSRLAWSLLAVAVIVAAAGLIFLRLAGLSAGLSAPAAIVFGMVIVSFPTVGALVVSYQPRNAIGWLFLGAGLVTGIQAFTFGYSEYALVAHGGRVPGGVVAAWMSDVVWLPAIVLTTTMLFLLFPDGRPLTRRWRLVVALAVAGAGLSAVAVAFEPKLYGHPEIRGPLAIDAVPQLIWSVLAGIGGTLVVAATIAAVASLVIRLRRAASLERQQIKWFAFAAALALIVALPLNFFDVGSINVSAFGALALLGIPVSVGFAIFKYRLYDIDRIINRTLVYGSLTVLLGGLYVAVVVGIGAVVGDSGLLVAASTLLVAALFRPVRSSIQDLIDRRFYRRRYDAARALEEFSATLRDEVDLDALNRELVAVVEETMQPAHVSVWLRAGGAE